MIKRPASTRAEPTVSETMRENLVALIRKKVEEINGIADYDPVVAMALIATDPVILGTKPDIANVQAPRYGIQLAANKEVAKYTRPQLKQVELTGAGGGPVEVKSDLASKIVDTLEQLSSTKESGT